MEIRFIWISLFLPLQMIKLPPDANDKTHEIALQKVPCLTDGTFAVPLLCSLEFSERNYPERPQGKLNNLMIDFHILRVRSDKMKSRNWQGQRKKKHTKKRKLNKDHLTGFSWAKCVRWYKKKMKYQNEPKRRNRWNTDCRCSCWKDVVLIKTLLVCGSNGSCTFSLLIGRLHLVGTETIRRCFTDMGQHRRPAHWIHHQHTHSACTVFQRASSDGDCSTNWMGYGEVMVREHQPSLVDNRWFRHQLGNWLRGRTKQTAKELLIEYLRGHIIKPFQPLHHQHRNNIVVIVKEKKKIRWWNNKTPVETVPKIFLNFVLCFWPERCRRGASGREGQVRWPNDQLTWINRSDVFSVGRSEPASARHIVREPSHRHIKKEEEDRGRRGGE